MGGEQSSSASRWNRFPFGDRGRRQQQPGAPCVLRSVVLWKLLLQHHKQVGTQSCRRSCWIPADHCNSSVGCGCHLRFVSLVCSRCTVEANQNKRLMTTEGISDRMGSVGNQFALTTINSFLFCIPLMFICEGHKLGTFFDSVITTPVVWMNIIFSGLWFYFYNELATKTIKQTGAVTQSVANTAKRAVVILGCALFLGESLGALKLVGSLVCIGGVFLYSVIDRLVARKSRKAVSG